MPKEILIPRLRLIALIVLLTLLIDQGTKIWAREYLFGTGSHFYFFNFLRFDFAENPGAFLSVGAGLGELFRFLIFTVGVSLILIWAILVLVRRPSLEKIEVFGFSFLLAGGVGNLIDRVMKGSVTDFVQVGFEALHTGVFNIADMAILLGVALLMIHSYWPRKAN